MLGSKSLTLNLIILSIAEIFGDFHLKFFARSNKLSNLLGGLAGYVGVVYFLIVSLKQSNVIFVNGMWDGVSAVLESIAAFVILGERLTNWHQYVGLFVIIAGIFLMRIGPPPS